MESTTCEAILADTRIVKLNMVYYWSMRMLVKVETKHITAYGNYGRSRAQWSGTKSS